MTQKLFRIVPKQYYITSIMVTLIVRSKKTWHHTNQTDSFLMPNISSWIVVTLSSMIAVFGTPHDKPTCDHVEILTVIVWDTCNNTIVNVFCESGTIGCGL